MSPFLTEAEIAELTKPLTQGAARCRRLRKMGLQVRERPDGQPIVRRVDFEAQPARGAAANDATPASRDWSQLRERVASRGGSETKGR